jgi:hypothetical protein
MFIMEWAVSMANWHEALLRLQLAAVLAATCASSVGEYDCSGWHTM